MVEKESVLISHVLKRLQSRIHLLGIASCSRNLHTITREEEAVTEIQKQNQQPWCAENLPKGTSNRIYFLKQLMEFKLDSTKKYYDHVFKNITEEIMSCERETKLQLDADTQMISFWLLKYKENCKEMDFQLRKMFDEWSSKERETAIMKKYKKLNSTKMENVIKQIEIRREFIEKYQKEEELKRIEEEKKERAAIIIQAFWRGILARKHLKQQQMKKKKKGKKKKGKRLK